MRSSPVLPRWWGTVVAAAAVLTAAGCSLGHNDAEATDAAELAPGDSAVSPDGVTTEVNAPAESTEAEYIAACLQARSWMDDHRDDQRSPVEAYLAAVQESGTADAGTWDTPWAQMSPQRQAALIVAVRAAADEACG